MRLFLQSFYFHRTFAQLPALFLSTLTKGSYHPINRSSLSLFFQGPPLEVNSFLRHRRCAFPFLLCIGPPQIFEASVRVISHTAVIPNSVQPPSLKLRLRLLSAFNLRFKARQNHTYSKSKTTLRFLFPELFQHRLPLVLKRFSINLGEFYPR